MVSDQGLDSSGVPDGWHPQGIMAGVPDINAAAAQSTLPAVMTRAQIGDVDWGEDGPPLTPLPKDVRYFGTPNPDPGPDVPRTVSGQETGDAAPSIGTDSDSGNDAPPWTVSGQDPGLVPPAATDPISHVRMPPDSAGYARDGEMAGQIFTDPYDPDGNTGNAGLAYMAGQLLRFHRGGALDAQAHGGSTADGNYDFGVYNAAAGIPLSNALDLANTYGKYFSAYDPKKVTMDQTYTHIPADNVQNITKGYNDFQGGKFSGTP